MSFKRCFRCLQVKPLDAFYRHAMMGDGHLNKCRECTKEDARQHRLANLERCRQYDRMRSNLPHRVEERREYAQTLEGRLARARARQQYAVSHALRVRANRAVRNAVRDGRLLPEPCFVCGAEGAQAHHPDYSAPLAVSWLCHKHHAQLHREHREHLREAA